MPAYDPPRMSAHVDSQPEAAPSSSSSSARVAVCAALVVAAGALAYSNSTSGVFLFDDHIDIDRNPAITSLDSLWRVVAEQGQSGVSGRPLVALSYAYNYAWCGLEPRGWHLVNIAIHILAALALFGVVRRALSAPPLAARWSSRAWGVALASAALWVAHPLTTGSVSYLGQRVESLMGLFFLATFYGALRAFAARDSKLWPIFASACCALGTGCKEVIVGAPLLVLLYDSLYVSGSAAAAWRARRGLYLGLFASWPLLALWVFMAQGRSESVGFGYSEVGVWSYLTTQAWAVAHYARLSVWPHPLVFDYGIRPITEFARYALPGAAVLAALALTVVGLVRRRPLAFLGAWWFVILAPTSSVLPIVTELIVEHRAYLPSAAVVLGLVLALSRALESAPRSVRSPLAWLLGVAACSGAVLATRARNLDYSSEIGMWLDVVEKLPDNDRARSSYGNDLVSAGREPEAGEHFAKAVELSPNNGYWRSNLGTWLLSRGDLERATEELERAVELLPDYGLALQNLGSVYSRRGQREKAFEVWRRALEHGAPMAGTIAEQMTRQLTSEGRTREALDVARAAMNGAPNDPRAVLALAKLLVEAPDTALRDPHQAAGLALKAVSLSGGDASAFEVLAEALVQQGRVAEAAGALQNAALRYRAAGRTAQAEGLERRAQQLGAGAGPARR